MNTIIAGSPNIQGDITSCKIENELININQKSIFSIQNKETYVSYDVCNKTIIKEYTVPSLTTYGFLIVVFGFILISIVLGGIINYISENY